jgi:transcriptional regulator with GAF, ATPase, and Fis domain
VNFDWRVTSFNRAADEIMGVSRSEATGRLRSDVFRSSMCGSDYGLEQTLSSDGYIQIARLPEDLTRHDASTSSSSDIRTAHKLLDAQSIGAALKRNDYNRLAATRELGIHRTTLFRRMRKLGLPLPKRDGR